MRRYTVSYFLLSDLYESKTVPDVRKMDIEVKIVEFPEVEFLNATHAAMNKMTAPYVIVNIDMGWNLACFQK